MYCACSTTTDPCISNVWCYPEFKWHLCNQLEVVDLIRMCLLTSGGPGVIDGSGVSHGGSHGGGDMPHHPCPNTAGAFWRINAAAGG